MSDNPQTTAQAGSDKTRCIIRIINIVSGLIMLGAGIGGIIFMAIKNILKFKFFLVFSPVFMMLFGIIFIAAECKLQFVTRRMGVINSLLGRAAFNIYLSSSVFYYFAGECGQGIQWLGWLLASLMFAIGIFYIVAYCCAGGRQMQQDQSAKDVKQQMM